MPGAIIVADQPDGAGSGTPGVARNDLWLDQEVELSVGTSGNTTYAWELLSVPVGSATTLSTPTSSTSAFTPDTLGTYRLRLVTNGGGPGNVQTRVFRVRYDDTGALANRGWVMPAPGEFGEDENNYASNTEGYAEPFSFIFSDLLPWASGLTVYSEGLLIGQRRNVNFIGVVVADNEAEDRVDVSGNGGFDEDAILDLAVASSVAAADVLPVVNDPGGTPALKKATARQIFTGGVLGTVELPAASSVVSTDIVPFVADPGGTPAAKYTTARKLFTGGVLGITDLTAASSMASTDELSAVIDPGGTPLARKVTAAKVFAGGVTGTTSLSGATPSLTDIIPGVVDPSGSPLAHKFTISDVVALGLPTYDTFANRPAAGTEGAQFFSSNTVPAHWVSTESTWRPMVNSCLGYAPPAANTFTQVNFGGSTTFADDGGGLLLREFSGVGTDQARVVLVAKPSGNYMFRCALLLSGSWSNYRSGGIVISDGTNAASSKMMTLTSLYDSGAQWFQVVKRNSAQSWSSNPFSSQSPATAFGSILYFTVRDNGSTRRWYISPDPFQYGYHLFTESSGTFLTETHIGLYANCVFTTDESNVRCLSWEAVSL